MHSYIAYTILPFHLLTTNRNSAFSFINHQQKFFLRPTGANKIKMGSYRFSLGILPKIFYLQIVRCTTQDLEVQFDAVIFKQAIIQSYKNNTVRKMKEYYKPT